jgi:hypothetical protein
MFKDHLIFSNNFQDAANQLRLHEAMSQKMKDEIKATLAMQAKADADRAARDNAPDPFDPTKTRKQRTDELVGQALDRARSRENYDELAKTAPNLAARARFSSQSIARSATPGTVTGVAGQGGTNSESDLTSFNSLSAEDQARVAPTQSTKRLEDMRKAQYGRAQASLARGKNNALGANVVAGQNTINKVLDDRKNNAMGGSNAAASYVRSWQQDPNSLQTQRSMAVRTDREKLAMNDAMYQEGLRQFKEKGKLSPGHVDMVNRFAKSGQRPTEEFKQFGAATREPLPQSGIDAYKQDQAQSAPTKQTSGKTFQQMQDERRYAQTNRLLNPRA